MDGAEGDAPDAQDAPPGEADITVTLPSVENSDISTDFIITSTERVEDGMNGPKKGTVWSTKYGDKELILMSALKCSKNKDNTYLTSVGKVIQADAKIPHYTYAGYGPRTLSNRNKQWKSFMKEVIECKDANGCPAEIFHNGVLNKQGRGPDQPTVCWYVIVGENARRVSESTGVQMDDDGRMLLLSKL